MIFYLLVIVAVGLERVVELRVSQRNLRVSLDRGGQEFGSGHYPFMVVLHSGLLVGCLLEAFIANRPFIPLLGWTMLGLVLIAQALRWWCISTLGWRWNTKIVVVAGIGLINTGPYRWLRHPNYVAVVIEGAALPLIRTGWITAITFTVLNAGLLAVRIKTENAALALTLKHGLAPVLPA